MNLNFNPSIGKDPFSARQIGSGENTQAGDVTQSNNIPAPLSGPNGLGQLQGMGNQGDSFTPKCSCS
jgi:hypothetical protein